MLNMRKKWSGSAYMNAKCILTFNFNINIGKDGATIVVKYLKPIDWHHLLLHRRHYYRY